MQLNEAYKSLPKRRAVQKKEPTEAERKNGRKSERKAEKNEYKSKTLSNGFHHCTICRWSG